MTIEDYQRNLRGVNGGDNFSSEFLVSFDILGLPSLTFFAAKHL